MAFPLARQFAAIPPCSTESARPVKPSRPTQSDDSALPGDFAQFRYGTKKVARTPLNRRCVLVTAYPAQFSDAAEVMSGVPGPADAAGPAPARIIGKLPNSVAPRDCAPAGWGRAWASVGPAPASSRAT